jgi:anti-anti-sigma regulatory factor
MKQASISVTSNKKKSVHIILEGSLIVGSLSTIKEELTAAISHYSTIQVTVTNVTAIDLTGIQLLFAIKKSSELLHKKLSFSIELPDEINKIISLAGFHNLPAILQSAESELIEK